MSENTDYLVEIELIHKNAKTPKYSYDGDAGADAYLCEDIFIRPDETKLVDLGFKLKIPEGFEFQIRPRSSLGKTKIRFPHSVGTIDSGNRQNIKLLLENIGNEPVFFKAGDRLCQLILKPIFKANYKIVTKVENNTARGTGGLGSSGK